MALPSACIPNMFDFDGKEKKGRKKPEHTQTRSSGKTTSQLTWKFVADGCHRT